MAFFHEILLNRSASSIVLLGLLLLGLSIACLFLPFGNIKIGGTKAKPIVTKVQWFAISFSTSISAGIIYWSCSEPLIYFSKPPPFLTQAQNFQEKIAIITGILWNHWSFAVYAIYTIPTITLAYLIYNKNLPVSLSSIFIGLGFDNKVKHLRSSIDTMCIFIMIAGMASSLATGILMLSGFVEDLAHIPTTPRNLGFFCSCIVVCFIISSISGLMKGIKWLSFINVFLMLIMAVMFLSLNKIENAPQILGESGAYSVRYLLNTGIQSIQNEVGEWSKKWTVFYWSSWIAWAPLTAIFLAQLSYGYRVKDMILMNFLYPSLITVFWLLLTSSTALNINLQENGLLSQMALSATPQKIMSNILNYFPFPILAKFLVLISGCVCFVTTADSNTTVLAQLSIKQSSKSKLVKKVNIAMKVVWGTCVGFIAWVMSAYLGIDGLRILNNVSALPAIILFLFVILRFLKIVTVEEFQGNSKIYGKFKSMKTFLNKEAKPR